MSLRLVATGYEHSTPSVVTGMAVDRARRMSRANRREPFISRTCCRPWSANFLGMRGNNTTDFHIGLAASQPAHALLSARRQLLRKIPSGELARTASAPARLAGLCREMA